MVDTAEARRRAKDLENTADKIDNYRADLAKLGNGANVKILIGGYEPRSTYDPIVSVELHDKLKELLEQQKQESERALCELMGKEIEPAKRKATAPR